jgi:hypothetical protein
MTEPYPRLEVTRILDKSTIVVAGRSIEELHHGEKVFVLASAGSIDGKPIYIPKATLEITLHGGTYAIARPEAIEVEESSPFAAFVQGAVVRKVRRRPSLSVVDEEVQGNPATSPIRVGDPVIRTGDLTKFIEEQAAASSVDI